MIAYIPHTDYTLRLVLLDDVIDPRLLRRREILDAFDGDPLTKEQAHELFCELGEIEASLQGDPAEIVDGVSSPKWFAGVPEADGL